MKECMNFKKIILIPALLFTVASASADTKVLDFEHWPSSDSAADISSAGGTPLSWWGAVSGDKVLRGRNELQISFTAPVIFNSAYYSPWGGVHDHSFRLFNGETLVYEGQATDPDSDGLMYMVRSSYTGTVDRIVFYGSSDGTVIDDFSYTTLAAVPEPQSGALMLAGLGLLGLVARRKRYIRARQ